MLYNYDWNVTEEEKQTIIFLFKAVLAKDSCTEISSIPDLFIHKLTSTYANFLMDLLQTSLISNEKKDLLIKMINETQKFIRDKYSYKKEHKRLKNLYYKVLNLKEV